MIKAETKPFKFHFVSDIHLGSRREPNFLLFKAYLQSLESKNVTHLFLMGDIFNLWVANHRYFIDEYIELIDEIKKQAQAGLEVHYFEGNHDFHLRQFWQNELGVFVYDSPQRLDVNGVRLYLAHGDEFDASDINYLRLRVFFRSPMMTFLAHHLPGVVVRAIGQKAEQKSHGHYLRENKNEKKIIQLLRNFAKAEYQVSNYDYLIAGHFHIRDEYKVNNKAKAINLGTWLEAPGVYEITSERAHFIDL